jgi:hypothetical protein
MLLKAFRLKGSGTVFKFNTHTTVSRGPKGYKNLLILLRMLLIFCFSGSAHVVFMASSENVLKTRWKKGEAFLLPLTGSRTFVMDHKVEWSTFHLPKLCFPPWLLLLSFSRAFLYPPLEGISKRLCNNKNMFAKGKKKSVITFMMVP